MITPSCFRPWPSPIPDPIPERLRSPLPGPGNNPRERPKIRVSGFKTKSSQSVVQPLTARASPKVVGVPSTPSKKFAANPSLRGLNPELLAPGPWVSPRVNALRAKRGSSDGCARNFYTFSVAGSDFPRQQDFANPFHCTEVSVWYVPCCSPLRAQASCSGFKWVPVL